MKFKSLVSVETVCSGLMLTVGISSLLFLARNPIIDIAYWAKDKIVSKSEIDATALPKDYEINFDGSVYRVRIISNPLMSPWDTYWSMQGAIRGAIERDEYLKQKAKSESPKVIISNPK